MHIADELQSVTLGQGYVNNHDIRCQSTDCRAGFPLGLNLPAHYEVRLRLDHPAQALPHDGVVIDDQNAPLSGYS
jgi:hypothetical protein